MHSISDEIYKDIEAKIVSGELKPGDKLPSENELCKIWSTSRISVRQALERMMVLGILKKVRGGGTYVSEPDLSIFLSPLLAFAIFREESVEDILTFRNIIEVGSVKLCAVNRDEDNLCMMRTYLNDMAASLNKNDNQKFNRADFNFHMEVAKGSKNQINLKFNKMLCHVVQKNQIAINVTLGASTSIKEHWNIYNAIEEKDEKLAAYFMNKHLKRTVDELKMHERY